MNKEYISKGAIYFEEHRNFITNKGYELTIDSQTIDTDNNSLGIDLLSPLKSFSIVIWEEGQLYVGGVDWEKDNAWNDNYTFENEEEMILQLSKTLELL